MQLSRCRLPGASGSLGANKNILIDTTAPAAAYGGQIPAVGAATFDFTVTYTDALAGIDFATLDSSDITVTGPNGFSASAAFISVDVAGNGSPRVATYRITAPGGTWNVTDNGTYTVSQNLLQVRDAALNYRPFGSIATFDATLPFAYVDGSTLVVDYVPAQASVTIGDDGSGNLTATEGSSLTFDPATFSSILVHGGSGNDAVVITTALAKPVSLDGQTGSDSITVASGGSCTFGADAGALSPDLSIAVNAGGAATFSASQHLSNLTIDGTTAITAGDFGHARDQRASITGKLDLADGAIAINYDGSSPLGTWNGSAYTDITGAIAAGRNGGTWDGATGIVTSMLDAQTRLATVGVAESATALGLTTGATTTWRGETVDDTSVLVRYTYLADANLSGDITGDDYFLIDTGYAEQTTGYGKGDFDFNGRIDSDDYFLIDSNYGHAAAPLAAPTPLAAGSAFVQATDPFAASDVPTDQKLLDELL